MVNLKQKSIESVIECSAIVLPKNGFIVLSIYRPPLGNFDGFYNVMEDILLSLSSLRKTYSTVSLCGDFNLNFKNTTDNKVRSLIDLFSSFGLQQTIHEPTRIGITSASIIDNIFVKSTILFESHISKNGLSDHFGQEIHFENKIQHQIQKKRTRIVTSKCLEKIRLRLWNVNWNEIFQDQNTNKCLYLLVNIISGIYNEICPEKLICISNKIQPLWLNNEIKNKCAVKRQLYEGVLNGKIPNQLYKNYCKYLNMIIDQRKRDCNTNYILRSQNKIKATWEIVNSITTNTKKQNFDLISLCEHYDKSCEQMLDHVNLFYANLGQASTRGKNHMNHIRVNERSMVVHNTTATEVYNIIYTLKDTSTQGADGLSTRLIKHCADTLCIPLSFIINECFENCSFPDYLKTALIKPIFKQGDQNDIQNYRPIAIIPVLAKIVEKAILSRMVNFAESCRLLTNYQNAYIQGRSTTRAIYMMIRTITISLSEKKEVAGVYLDLSKAFNSVDHDILLHKLEKMGYRGEINKLIRSYLKDRLQCTVADYNGKDMRSKWRRVNCGVPQGSILGPFLFLLYINDLPEISKYFINMFADDTSVIIAEPNISLLTGQIMNTMSELNNWFQNNNLNLNVDKTHMLKFALQKSETISINFGNVDLVSTEHTKFLGLELDNLLNWKEHVDILTKKLSGMIYALRVVSTQVRTEAAMAAYHAYVASRLSYGIVFWGNSVEAARIFVLQKSCIRSIFGLKKRESCSVTFKQNNILTLPGLYIFECACFARKHYNELLVEYESTHDYNTREFVKSTLRIPQATSARIHKSATIQILKIYNYLPQSYKSASLRLFKCKLKRILIDICLYKIEDFFSAVL